MSASLLPFRPFCSPPAFASSPSGRELSSCEAINFVGAYLPRYRRKQRFCKTVRKVSAVAVPSTEELKEYSLPSWSEFELGMAPVFWKSLNGLPPTSGETLTLFYNPAATNLFPNDDYGIAFNGGFNQPIMCGGEPRVMTRKNHGKADPPIFTIKICVPKHAVSLIFSFTNGVDWDGPYRLQFQVLKMWQNKPMNFFNEIQCGEVIGLLIALCETESPTFDTLVNLLFGKWLILKSTLYLTGAMFVALLEVYCRSMRWFDKLTRAFYFNINISFLS